MKKGFTLIELLVVITILAVLAGAALPYVQNYVEESRIAKAKTDLEEIARALAVYETREGEYTKDTVEDLTGRYLNKAPIDPWGNPYKIDVESGLVISYGPDRSEITEEDNIQAPYQPPLALVSVKWIDRNQSGAVDTQNVRDQVQLVFSRKLTPISTDFDKTNMADWFVLSPDGTTPTEGDLTTTYFADETDATTDYRPKVLSTNTRVVVLTLHKDYTPSIATPLSPGAAYIYVSTPDAAAADLTDLAGNLCIGDQKVKILPQ